MGEPFINCQIEAANLTYSEILYYNKSGTIWGSPFALSTSYLSGKSHFAKTYPNPVIDLLRLELPQSTLPAGFNMFHPSGRMVMQQMVYRRESQLDMCLVNPGFYTYASTALGGAVQADKLVVR